MKNTEFPKDFLWGAATAAPQIEGGYLDDGRTPSIWDVAPEEKIKNNANCHEACDHYHRMREDVAIMKEIGLKSYRFSVSWSRVIPKEGVVNKKGLQFYIDLVDELRANDIEPMVTIFHWDLPVWVYEKGGWLSEKIIPLFADYTKVLVDALSDKVTYWMPMNEPQCFIMNGYMQGAHAPFKHRYLALSKLTKICLMAFHDSVDIIRKYAKTPPKIGIAMAAGAFIPKSDSEEDVEEAREKTFYSGLGAMGNRWWCDPVFKGEPAAVYGVYRTHKKDMLKIKCKLDFVGVNVYQPFMDGSWGNKPAENTPKEKLTSMGWLIDGRVLYYTIKFFYERYDLPVLVTENGMADNDIVVNGEVKDDKRIKFINDYLSSVKRAVSEGIPVMGYQYWSLMDNFEWAEGYAPRFGLIYVDYETQRRTLKNSAYYYRQIIESNGEII
ncbi:MAG: glycoside hydrolase family 1 protein [Eubacterium sp.]